MQRSITTSRPAAAAMSAAALVLDAELHPQAARADRDGLARDRRNIFGFAEAVDDVDLLPGRRQCIGRFLQ